MSMNGVTIPIDFELTERSRILLDALAKVLPARFVEPPADTAQAAQATAQPGRAPKIGERWPEHGGIYAGVSRGEGDEPDAHLILLDDKPTGKLDWADAVKWAESLGDGARLPTRFECALLYANLQDQMDTTEWHWTGTQYSDSRAWTQRFSDGNQLSLDKSYEARCRAVRRLIL